MTIATLHPWLNTPEAVAAAKKAVRVPMTLMGGKAMIIGPDELLSEALIIMTECALPPRERLTTTCVTCGGQLDPNRRKGAKFCSDKCRETNKKRVARGKAETAPKAPASHIGSMWEWPEDKMESYAIRQVGFLLNNYLRAQQHSIETASSEALANMSLAAEEPETTPAEVLGDFLSDYRGVKLDGTETFEELYEAAVNLGLIDDLKASLEVVA